MTVFILYFFYAAKKEGKDMDKHKRSSLGIVISVFCAHIFGSGFINGLGYDKKLSTEKQIQQSHKS